MWIKIVRIILRYRLVLIVALGLATAFMLINARYIHFSRNFIQVVPDDDADYIYYQKFYNMFGKDAGGLVTIGIKDQRIYELDNFRGLRTVVNEIEKIKGIKTVLSLPNISYLKNNSKSKRFDLIPLFDDLPSSQKELDSLLNYAHTLKFYKDKLWNVNSQATMIFVYIESDIVNSNKRIPTVSKIIKEAELYSKKTGIQLHYSGLPYIRNITAKTVEKEIILFAVFSFLMTIFTLFLFFRTFTATIYPMILVGILVIWVLGTLGLLGYEVTILTGLLPSVLIIIAIPNSIYMLNKYHQEFVKHKNKIKALATMIRKIGFITLITNMTTAVGFLVLIYTQIPPLVEFGIVAALNIMATFIISLIFIPIVFSYLPAPQDRHTKHLNFKLTNILIQKFEKIVVVKKGRTATYIVTVILVIIGFIGIFKIHTVSHMIDDLPESSNVKKDSEFFETNFKGILPFDIIIDTQKKRGYRNLKNLKLIAQLEENLSQLPYISPGISIVTFLKAANQAFFEDSARYRLPNQYVQGIIFRNLKNQSKNNQITSINNLVDTTGQYIRIAMQVADIGSEKMRTFIDDQINPLIDSTLIDSDIKARATGGTFIFFKGNDFLVKSLRSSILLAFLLISLLMGLMFKKIRIIVISLIPNLVPLIMTAGLMGWVGIPLKPTTALVFSVAFGISVDDSIHFLAKYKQELKLTKNNIYKSIRLSIQETGKSMFYTSIVLFFGFIIFTASDFGGTVLLGFLSSITLLAAMFTNLILLPSLLWSFHTVKR